MTYPGCCDDCGFSHDEHEPGRDAAFCVALRAVKVLGGMTEADVHRDYWVSIQMLCEIVPALITEGGTSRRTGAQTSTKPSASSTNVGSSVCPEQWSRFDQPEYPEGRH